MYRYTMLAAALLAAFAGCSSNNDLRSFAGDRQAGLARPEAGEDSSQRSTLRLIPDPSVRASANFRPVSKSEPLRQASYATEQPLYHVSAPRADLTTPPRDIPGTTPGTVEAPESLGQGQISDQRQLNRAGDYSWLQGRLDYTAMRGGLWKLRYAEVSVDDQYGGSVILDIDPTEMGLQAGDLVVAKGELDTSQRRDGLPCPLYKVRELRRVQAGS